MKYKWLYPLCMALLLICEQMSAATSGACGSNLQWSLDDKGVLTITGTGTMRDYSLEKKQEAPWLPYKKNITCLKIDDGITSIGDFAFAFCIQVTSVTIPNSVTNISKGAFYNCLNLTSITIPDNVTSIGELAFYNCTNLSSVTIPDNVTSIRKYSFAFCSHLTSITIPDKVTSIGEYAFHGCRDLTSITIPDNVTYIGEYAFYNCNNLTSITIPNSVKSIGKYAFSYCNNIEELKYPKGLDLSEADIPSTTKLIAYDKTIPPTEEPRRLPKEPPLLTFVDGSLIFAEANGNNCIDADEKCFVKFKVTNKGKGAAVNCEARIKLSGAKNGITVKTTKLPTIAPGSTCEVSVPVHSSVNTTDGQVAFTIEVYEPRGWGIAPFTMTVVTKAYDPPFLQVVDYNIASTSGKIRKMEPFTLTFNVQNTKYGDAEDVKVKVIPPSNVFVMDERAELSFPRIRSGEVKSIQLTLAANNNYPTTNIPITIDIKEKHGQFAENKQLDIALNQTTSSSINIAAKDEPQKEHKEIQLALLKSDVDRNIPATDTKNKNTFVVVIANEDYEEVASVPFALNDGKVFASYCQKTLGIPESNIHVVENATLNKLKREIDWLSQVLGAYKGDAKAIFYYAGHGIPDEKNRDAFLLPVDGYGNDIKTGYQISKLYQQLGAVPAKQVVVIMDACFSGAKREGGMLVSARGVAIKVNNSQPTGNMIVLSAAQGDETAYPNNQEGHGMFTYFLLKKLQETKGNVSLQDLGNYVITNVTQQSVVLNGKSQTPCVTPSAAVGTEWQSWKLK